MDVRLRSTVSWFLILCLLLTMGMMVVLFTPWAAHAQMYITVTRTDDNPITPDPGSLRQAILDANATGVGPEIIINFDSGVSFVQLQAELPAVTRTNSGSDNVQIDGEYEQDR